VASKAFAQQKVVDEADSILIDEARVPLIIALNMVDVAENRFDLADVKVLQREIKELTKELESAQRRLDSLVKGKK